MAKGTIKWFNARKGYGFITREGQEDVFIHISNWQPQDRKPREGEEVVFDIGPGREGPEAKNVRPAGHRFLNPYNFVRYLEQRRPENHVLGDCPPPPHDRYVGLTGRITCTVEAKTPLFISDSHAIEEKPDDHKSYRFFQYDGKPALPASSLRGMVRSVFEAVTNSCFGVFDGGRLDIREGRLPRGLVPARVVEVNDDRAKLELLDCSDGYPNEVKRHWRKGKLIPLMKAASVSAYEERVLDTDEEPPQPFDPIQSKIPDDVKDRDRVAALVSLELVNNQLYEYFPIVKIVPVARHEKLNEYDGVKKVFGYAHITGPNIERKHLERIFFRWDDTSPKPPDWKDVPGRVRLEVDAKTVDEYNQHLDDYWQRNRSQVQKLNTKGHPWPVDASSLPHPSIFVEEGRKLREGDLVNYIPRSKAGLALLRPVLISRLPYRFSRADLLSNWEHLEYCDWHDWENGEICPACRVFGWVYQKKRDEQISQDKITAYAGRVRFSHGEVKTWKEFEGDITLAILSTPKPTTTEFYLLDSEGKPDFDVDYDDKNARLRGRKFYRHHGEADTAEYTGEPSNQNRTVRDALKPGATFTFTVDFENLAPVELGALLYALELEDDLVHRLGYAKPLGFGSVRVTVDAVKTVDWRERLESLDAGWQEREREKIDDLKRNFLQTMRDLYGEEFDAKVLADLHALLGEPPVDLPVHYPRPSKEPDADGKNYKWFVGNEKRIADKHKPQKKRKNLPEPVALDPASEDTQGLPMIDENGNEVPL
jgi:CRISPR-associated protein (TIGR03986 family)